MKQSCLWSSLGTHGSLVVIWWLYISSSGETRKFAFFKVKFDLEGEGQLLPKTRGTLTKVFCTSGPHLVVLAWTGDELSRGQAQNGVNFYFEVKFDLEGQGQSPPKTIGILNIVFYTYAPNLVILAWMGDELSRGQTWWRTDWRTDRHRQRQYPEAKTGLG